MYLQTKDKQGDNKDHIIFTNVWLKFHNVRSILGPDTYLGILMPSNELILLLIHIGIVVCHSSSNIKIFNHRNISGNNNVHLFQKFISGNFYAKYFKHIIANIFVLVAFTSSATCFATKFIHANMYTWIVSC